MSALILSNEPISLQEMHELNMTIQEWIPKVRSRLKSSALQFQDGKTDEGKGWSGFADWLGK